MPSVGRKRWVPWISLVALIVAVGAAAVLGSRGTTTTPIPTRTTSASPRTGEIPLCRNGSTIPPGALACRPTGVHPDAQASEAFGWTFEVTNSYSGIFRGRYITVYAGAVLAPDPTGKTAHGFPNGGGIRVTMDSGTNAQQFLLPGTLGLLSIKSVRGDIVDLQRQDDTTVMFNLATDSYS